MSLLDKLYAQQKICTLKLRMRLIIILEKRMLFSSCKIKKFAIKNRPITLMKGLGLLR